MIRIRDSLGSESIQFHYCETRADLKEAYAFATDHAILGMDTESTGINCYKRGWQLRTFQFANATDSYVIPAKNKRAIGAILELQIKWIGHNGPHDVRSLDHWLDYTTGIHCAGETYIPAHHSDSRNQKEGGISHGLKEQAIAFVSRDAGKWETELKKAFKQIQIEIPGEVYKSGPRKGTQKYRKANLSEGWGLIDPTHPAYIAYAAADPLLTYRLYRHYQPVVREFYLLYQFDIRVQEAADRLQRRAIRLDVDYTERLSAAYLRKANEFKDRAARYGCHNINSGAQIAETIIRLGGKLTRRTESGSQFKTDDGVLRHVASTCRVLSVQELIHCILGAKQLLKRRENYTEAMLREMDAEGRVHPSINTLGARTTRMSVSNPALQQLPTKDREEDAA